METFPRISGRFPSKLLLEGSEVVIQHLLIKSSDKSVKGAFASCCFQNGSLLASYAGDAKVRKPLRAKD